MVLTDAQTEPLAKALARAKIEVHAAASADAVEASHDGVDLVLAPAGLSDLGELVARLSPKAIIGLVPPAAARIWSARARCRARRSSVRSAPCRSAPRSCAS